MTDRTWVPLGAGCIAVGIASIIVSRDYSYGTITAMGPGFVPTAVAALLVLFGAAILVQRGADVATASDDPARDNEDGTGDARQVLRPILCIVVAILLFAGLVASLGLLATTFLVVVVAGFAYPKRRIVPLLTLAATLATAAALIFVALLGLNIPLLPKAV